MDLHKSQEETLREAACIGDFEGVQELLLKGVNPNSQNAMNGWSALHWSAKRGHKNIIQALLEYGADPNLQNVKGEIAANLTADLNIAQLLGAVNISDVTTPKKEDNSFTPHYLAHPPLNARVDGKPIKPSLIPEQHNITSNTMNKPNSCAACQHHPDEMVLKIRIANSPDPDFIEVEIPEANFSSLLRVCCEELGIPAQRVTRVRKLPNTVVRKDKDVQRLQYLQELELVVEDMFGGGPFGVNGEVALTKSNSYQSISKYKNQTILY